MIIKVNKEKLSEILKHFYKITGLKVTIFSTEQVPIAEYPKTHCSFCSYINSKYNGKKICEKSNWSAIEKCKKNKKPYIYKCPFKLVEIAIPLIKEGAIIGYAIAGQITNHYDKNDIKNALLNYDKLLEHNKALTLTSSVNYHENEKLKSEIKILEICSTYLLSSDMIEIKDDMHHRILAYINEHAYTDFKIEDLCKALNTSRTLLYKIFKETEGIGISEYIKDLKIKKAISLLQGKQYSIKEIAYMCGFSDSNHFINLFKKHTGKTPKQFQIQSRY